MLNLFWLFKTSKYFCGSYKNRGNRHLIIRLYNILYGLRADEKVKSLLCRLNKFFHPPRSNNSYKLSFRNLGAWKFLARSSTAGEIFIWRKHILTMNFFSIHCGLHAGIRLPANLCYSLRDMYRFVPLCSRNTYPFLCLLICSFLIALSGNSTHSLARFLLLSSTVKGYARLCLVWFVCLFI